MAQFRIGGIYIYININITNYMLKFSRKSIKIREEMQKHVETLKKLICNKINSDVIIIYATNIQLTTA